MLKHVPDTLQVYSLAFSLEWLVGTKLLLFCSSFTKEENFSAKEPLDITCSACMC